jgi:glutaredoxin
MAENEVKKLLNEIQENNHKEITVYALEGCPACIELKDKLDKIGVQYENVVMDGNEAMWKQLEEWGGSDFAPQVKVEGYLIKEDEYDTVNELISKTLTNLLGRDIIIK